MTSRPSARRLARLLLQPEEQAWLPDLFEQASRLNLRSSIASPTTVALIVALMWGSAPHRGLCVWAAITLFGAAWQVLFHRWYQRSRSDRSTDEWLRWGALLMAVCGAGWGSLPLLAMPDSRHAAWQAMIGLFVMSFMAANTIFSAPLCRLFYAFQVPVAVVSTVGLLAEGSGITRMLAVVVLYSLPFSAVLHYQGNMSAIAAVSLSHRNDALVEQLHEEQRRIESANAELLEANQQLAHRAGHDGLTGLANRLLFHEHLARALQQGQRSAGSVAVLFFDLDRFKVVNDSLGHAHGDELLVAVAARATEELRDGDVLARLGGDEFTVLLGSIDGPRAALRVAEAIRQRALEPFELSDRSVQISVSIGLAVNTGPDDTADDLLRHADAAMYRAKMGGRNRVEIFDDNFRSSLARRLDEEAEVRNAFASNQIVTWFQPEVELATGRIVGAEALVRWLHPDRGVISAGAFVPLAEECGMLMDISRVASTESVDARLSLLQVVGTDFRLRVNVAASQLMDPDLLSRYLARTRRVGLDPSLIAFEVTETAVISDVEVARRWLATARDAGIRVLLDDFGTGYSSLAMLAQLPLDGVKIDISFVRALTTSLAARAVVSSTVELARMLGMGVVAEGVEEPEQARLLGELGVTRAQGYLFSPAVPIDTLRGWLSHGAPWEGQDSSAGRSRAERLSTSITGSGDRATLNPAI